MGYMYKEYNFKDCTITKVADSIYIDIGRNHDIIPYISDFISDKLEGIEEIVIDYINDGNRKRQTVIYKIEKGKNKGTWGYRYYGKYTTISKKFCDLLNRKEVSNEIHR